MTGGSGRVSLGQLSRMFLKQMLFLTVMVLKKPTKLKSAGKKE